MELLSTQSRTISSNKTENSKTPESPTIHDLMDVVGLEGKRYKSKQSFGLILAAILAFTFFHYTPIIIKSVYPSIRLW